MTVLILGSEEDAHARHMRDVLLARQIDVEYLDGRWFPSTLQIAFDPTRPDGHLKFPSGRVVPFEEIRTVYWRCYQCVQSPALPDPEQAFIAGNDARALFETVLIQLPARWVNGWRAYQLHQTKPVQLALVQALGVPVPATLLTNDPEAVRCFVERHPRCIFKPVQGGAHTQRVTAAHLTDVNLANLVFAPVTLQEEVAGTNIRVFVVGERVLACEVRTEALDFRDDQDPCIIPHELPADVAVWCLRAARALDLLWTGIDLRLTEEGWYWFLEANPSPMFLGFESRCGLPLTDSLAALLAERS